ncbi:uncharacterized protein LOC121637646 [Melanotaenia boesemani]|uniref:uncharacterized protein LOC121637646 n=1 Tax=Melanotaenia boesemani TaxID=1250792 RepID=UPI001C05CEAE|nr:uncharacterized protein LOC121637646 [Melanotaenia boesemani]
MEKGVCLHPLMFTVMDLRTVVIISSVVLVAAGLNQSSLPQTSGHNNSELTNTSTSPCSCSAAPTEPSVVPTSSADSFTPILGLLTVNWTKKCEGIIYLIPYLSFNKSSLPVCDSPDANIQILLKNVCNNKYCMDVKSWSTDKDNTEGYNITKTGAEKMASCKPLSVRCTAEDPPDVERELQAFKVVTALLCCVLLVLLIIRFTRPTVTALQSRLSDKRRERWIGPTQSHSVSYHRGKAAVRSNDEEKRLSYPALERLTVRDSSDMSCSRNSGYDF